MQSGQPQRGCDEGRSRIAPSGELRYSDDDVVRARISLDRHGTCIVAAYFAGAAR